MLRQPFHRLDLIEPMHSSQGCSTHKRTQSEANPASSVRSHQELDRVSVDACTRSTSKKNSAIRKKSANSLHCRRYSAEMLRANCKSASTTAYVKTNENNMIYQSTRAGVGPRVLFCCTPYSRPPMLTIDIVHCDTTQHAQHKHDIDDVCSSDSQAAPPHTSS